jgi:nicotinamide-nucleotide amidase
MVNACVLTIGDEILIGQVVDTNSAWIGQKLREYGISLTKIVSIGDDHQDIVDNLKDLTATHDLVLITGGLGPTKDDITKKAIADFLNVEMFFHEETYLRIQKIFEILDRPISQSHYDQCFMPEGVKILRNSMGTAPGMWFEKEDFCIVSMPGVPYEMKAIMGEELLSLIKQKYVSCKILNKTLLTAGKGETEIEDIITPVLNEMPPHLKIAYLPGLGQVRVRISIFGEKDNDDLDSELKIYSDKIENKLNDIVFGYEDSNLETEIGKICITKNLKIGTVESCTGGAASSRLVSVPGASSYFEGSIIAYSNLLKNKILSVDENILSTVGAVSEEAVKSMIDGGIDALNTNAILAISGIAGPTGGTTEKPVGTIWIAAGNKEYKITKLLKNGKNREKNIELAAQHGLNLLRKFLLTQ